ncbi:MAG: hypothetical protein QOJ02_1560 [Acidobacteriota bacterium]|jgi:hypothetical protein|nr:hypothetical protein [Acidobacteriota bacterium]
MKSTFLKAIKMVALSLVLTLGASGVIFANGAGAPTTIKAVALNGGGNGAGGSTKRKTKRVAKRVAKRRSQRTA